MVNDVSHKNRTRTSSTVFFWIVCVLILAAVVAAFWDVVVVYVVPFIDAVRDAYF